MFIEPMQAMQILRQHAYSMEPKKVFDMAMLATDDRGFAEDLWAKIANEKMEQKLDQE